MEEIIEAISVSALILTIEEIASNILFLELIYCPKSSSILAY